ncbi:MAG: TIGR02996 domain-containing protein [Kofleriaceae bacterium]
MEAEDLIAALIDAPDDEEPWLVYTDWLLDRGHPRGELISLQAGVDAEDPAAIWRMRAIESQEDDLLSPQLRAEAKYWRFEWKRGFMSFVEHVRTAGPPTDEAVAALCADPHAGLLRALAIDRVETAPAEEKSAIHELDSIDGERPASCTSTGKHSSRSRSSRKRPR